MNSVTNGTNRFRYCIGFEHTCPDLSSGSCASLKLALSTVCRFIELDENGQLDLNANFPGFLILNILVLGVYPDNTGQLEWESI